MSFWNVIGAGIGALGGLAGNAMNRAAIREQNKANKELAKYQFDLNMQAWNKQNEYNSPYQQVARLKSAGLNPQLAYGNGTQAGNASSVPQYQAPNIESYQGNAADLSRALSGAMTYMQLQNMQAQNNLLAKQAEKEEAHTWLLDEQAMEKLYENKYNLEWSNNAKALAQMDYSIRHNQTVLSDWNITKIKQEYSNLVESGKAINLDNQIRAIDLLYKDKLSQAQLNEFKKRAEHLGASAAHFDALANQIRTLTPDQLQLIKQQFKNLEQDFNILGPTANMAEELGISPQMANFFKIIISIFK